MPKKDKSSSLIVHNEDINYLVSKSNALIEAKYLEPLNVQKLVTYGFAKVNKGDTGFQELLIREEDVKELFGQVNVRQMLAKTAGDLYNASIDTLVNEDEVVRHTRWVTSCAYVKGEAAVRLKLNNDLFKHVLQVNTEETEYDYRYLKEFRSGYSVRFYELLNRTRRKTNAIHNSITLDIIALRDLLELGSKYKKYSEFNKNVIQRAIEDLNTTDLHNVIAEPIRSGRKFTHIRMSFDCEPVLEVDVEAVEVEK